MTAHIVATIVVIVILILAFLLPQRRVTFFEWWTISRFDKDETCKRCGEPMKGKAGTLFVAIRYAPKMRVEWPFHQACYSWHQESGELDRQIGRIFREESESSG